MVPPFSYLNMDALNWTFEGESNTNTNTNTNTNKEAKPRAHTFVEGDTLWALASKYYGNGNYWEALAIYNGIDNPRKISNGTVVVLPAKSVLKDIREGNYLKDLYTISKETYGTSKYAGYLAALNNIPNSGLYYAKQLNIPSANDINEVDAFEYQTDGYYVVKKGDTLKKISELVYDDASFADYLAEVNGITKVEEGMTILIPVMGYVFEK